jgi:HK97 family phage major capsid protein
LGYKFGVTEEKAFLTGNGTGQPLGVFTASASGISTARDVTAATTTSFTADNLIDMKYSLKQGYQQDAATAWVLSRTAVKLARKLKVASTTGGNDLEYIWQPGITGGAPDRILDIPYYMSEYAPATFTTGLYVAVLGCFRFYKIAQVQEMMIQRLVELYSGTNEIGFIARRWVDGAPILEEAFSRLKLA